MPYATIDDFDLYYEVIGSGPPVLCSTGWGTGTGHRVAMYPEELSEHFSLVVYDHRGIGRSRGGLSVEPSTERYADDLVKLADHLGIADAVVFGRGGLGGCIAQIFAAKNPERTKAAVFSQAWHYADPWMDHSFAFAMELRERSFAQYQLNAALLSHRPDYFNTHVDELTGDRGGWTDIRDNKEGHLALISASRTHDTRDLLPSITAPSLVVQSTVHDLVTGRDLGVQQHDRLPNAELVLLEESPHAIRTHEQSWNTYRAALRDFLHKVGGR
ncbi:alpha/beta fold hydrolase [Amycolatopsis sp. GM8]|uniref:alpha/beta fold hydrolase n=1 Tax=Amycolatopsis sp. GM8 TaxID=2896530 RepID=UPI001F1FCAC8|nr:alpha/beta hydrolase [Amycolatopsis sp. GM8]